MIRSSESHGTYQTVDEYNAEVRRRAAVADPRDATISHLQSELDRCREALKRAADDFDLTAAAIRKLPALANASDVAPAHSLAFVGAQSVRAALGGSNDKG